MYSKEQLAKEFFEENPRALKDKRYLIPDLVKFISNSFEDVCGETYEEYLEINPVIPMPDIMFYLCEEVGVDFDQFMKEWNLEQEYSNGLIH